MSNETRGNEIKARRLALGIKSVREFAEASGIDREALGKAERGLGSGGTYDRAEAWLARMEEETGHDEPALAAAPIRLTFHDVFGVGEIIAEGPADKPDELIAAVSKLLAELRAEGGR
jgi:transcriptional regulator with XRE-family HTH domain